MTNEITQNKKPNYTGEIKVSAWIKTNKYGKQYISCKLDNFFQLFEQHVE